MDIKRCKVVKMLLTVYGHIKGVVKELKDLKDVWLAYIGLKILLVNGPPDLNSLSELILWISSIV